MNEKFMKIKRIMIPTLTMVIIASQLFGCAATTQEETLNLIQQNQMIEIEIAVPKDQEQGTQSALTWEVLAKLDTYQDTLREPMENVLGVKFNEECGAKTGMLYQLANRIIPNNTLKAALQNSEFRAAVDNDEIISQLADVAFETFIDLEEDEEMTNFYMAINAYFNLLPATEENYANPQNVLTRADFMSLVMRAETPYVDTLNVNEDFATAVGESEYNKYAQALAESSYLTLADKSLNEKTYNGSMSRGEAVYMLMNHYYADELANIDIANASLEDTKDGGDIATAQGYIGKDYATSYVLNYMITNPDQGVDTEMYKALVLAEQKGFIDSETCFDEAITLEEAVELLVSIYKTLPIDEEALKKCNAGDLIYDETTGDYGVVGYDYGLTNQEILNDEDNLPGGKIMYNEDNTTYVIWEVGPEAGNIYYPGDTLPDGTVYLGSTEEDQALLAEMW